jgi:hypothetical protein
MGRWWGWLSPSATHSLTLTPQNAPRKAPRSPQSMPRHHHHHHHHHTHTHSPNKHTCMHACMLHPTSHHPPTTHQPIHPLSQNPKRTEEAAALARRRRRHLRPLQERGLVALARQLVEDARPNDPAANAVGWDGERWEDDVGWGAWWSVSDGVTDEWERREPLM